MREGAESYAKLAQIAGARSYLLLPSTVTPERRRLSSIRRWLRILADICLVPQVFNANRFSIDTSGFPTIQRIYDHAMTLDAFKAAAPGAQPDAE